MNHTHLPRLSFWRLLPLLAALMLPAVTIQAQTPADPLPPIIQPPPGPLDYYPLQEGNQWVYEISGALVDQPDRTVDCNIILETPNVIIARMLNSFWGDLNVYQLQQDLGITYPQGLVFAAADEGTSGTFLFPSLDEGTFPSAFEPGCPDRPEQMRVEWAGTVTVPAGTFNRCARIRIDCPQLADYQSEYIFAPDVGLIRYTITGLPGIVVQEELLRAKVNGVVYENFEEDGVEARLVSNRHFFLGFDGGPNIDRVADPLPDAHMLRAKFEIKNNDDLGIILGFPTTCQQPVFEIKDLAGAVIWTTAGFCATIPTQRTLEPGASETYFVNANLLNLDGSKLPDGSYMLSATTASQPAFSASIPFLVRSLPVPGPLPEPPPPPKD